MNLNWDCMNWGINCDPAVVMRDFYGGVLLIAFGFLVTVIWGKLAGYTNKKDNPETAEPLELLSYFVIAAFIVIPLLSALAWVYGKIFG